MFSSQNFSKIFWHLMYIIISLLIFLTLSTELSSRQENMKYYNKFLSEKLWPNFDNSVCHFNFPYRRFKQISVTKRVLYNSSTISNMSEKWASSSDSRDKILWRHSTLYAEKENNKLPRKQHLLQIFLI